MANSNIKVIVDCYVPYVEGLLEPYCDVEYLHPSQITPEAVRHADALIIRTRTRCNADLLDGSRVQFIATATIGMDHIDQDYCRQRGIAVANAPGCNAPAVAQYVFGVLLRLVNRPLSQHTLGIVGVGNVGRVVERWARSLSMDVLLCDPPRARREGPDAFVTLDEIARRADIITLHTPLTRLGDDATYHLFDRQVVDQLRRAPIVINAARGPVADSDALVYGLQTGKIRHAIIDCWEGEPTTANQPLLDMASVATPHIAGYSDEGKRRAGGMALKALFDHFGIVPATPVAYPPLDKAAPNAAQILRSFDIADIEAQLRAHPNTIDQLRDHYPLRHEP